ncbi:SRPBCC family protein [Azospirillum sp. sgz302134]
MAKAFWGTLGSTKAIKMAAAASVLAIVAASTAQAADKIKVVETVQLDVPAAKVWSVIGNFAALEWHPAVKSMTTSEGNARGSQRHINLGGPVLVETLLRHDAKAQKLTYKILDNGTNQKILPVSNYVSTMQVKPSGKGSTVVWSSTFDPAPGADRATAEKTIRGVYRGGLDNLPKVVTAP